MRYLCFFSLLVVTIAAHSQTVVSGKEPKVKWKFAITAPFIASPVGDGSLVFVGGLDSVLYAIENATGKIRWKFQTRGPIRAAVTAEGNNVILNGGDGTVYCLEKQTGKRVWSFASLGGILGERRYDQADYFDSQPAVFEKNVYFGCGDGKLYALDAASGKLQWFFKAEDIIHTSPAIANNKIFFGSSDGHLYCLNHNGTLAWKFKSVGHYNFPKGEMQGSPVVARNRVFVGSRDYNLYALDQSGYGNWNRQFPMGWATALTATDSVLYAGTSDDRLFLALNPATGREIWKVEAGFNIFGPPSVYKSNVYFGTQMGKLFEVNRKTGAVNWIFKTDGYRNNRLKYFKDDDSFRDDLFSRIKTFDAYLKMLYSLGAIYSTPLVTESGIFVSTSEGVLYCLEK